MNWKTPVILAVLLLVLGGFSYWHEFQHAPQQEKKENASKTLFASELNLEKAPIKTLEVSLKGDEPVKIECTDTKPDQCTAETSGRWTIHWTKKGKSFTANGDSYEIKTALHELAQLKWDQQIDLTDDSADKRAALLGDYELGEQARASNKATRISLQTASGKTHTLWFGAKEATGGNLYALRSDRTGDEKETIQDSKIALVANSSLDKILKPSAHWREKRVSPWHPPDVISIDFKGENAAQRFSIRQNEPGKAATVWTLNGGAPAETDAVSHWVSNLSFLAGTDIAAESPADPEWKSSLASTKEYLQAKIETKNGEGKTSHFVKVFKKKKEPRDQYLAYSQEKGPLYILAPALAEELQKTAKDFQVRTLLDKTEKTQIAWVKISNKKETHIYSKDGSSWKKDGQPWSNAKNLTSLLERLSANLVESYPASMDSSKTADEFSIQLGTSEKEIRKEFQFVRKGKKVYSKSSTGMIAEISASFTDQLPWSSDFLEKEVKSSPPPSTHNEDHSQHSH